VGGSLHVNPGNHQLFNGVSIDCDVQTKKLRIEVRPTNVPLASQYDVLLYLPRVDYSMHVL
jgi:hypothetical protein